MKKITWIALIAILVMGCTLGAQDNRRDEDRSDQQPPKLPPEWKTDFRLKTVQNPWEKSWN
jgi:hypothetical protein